MLPLLETTWWLSGTLITSVLICPLQDGDRQLIAGGGARGEGVGQTGDTEACQEARTPGLVLGSEVRV